MGKDVWSILRKRYPEEQYALMAEVRDKAGHYASRSADFIAVGLWPSRGLAVNGIELKSFRGDWLNELKKPAKAENIYQYCDYFWLLTEDDTIAKIEEIPATWGWLVIKGNRIIQKKDAPKLDPKPVSKHFMAAMLKRASDKGGWIRKDSIQEEIDASYRRGKTEDESSSIRVQRELDNIREVVKQFTEASGIALPDRSWFEHPRDIGHAVKFIRDGGAEKVKKQLLELESSAKEILENITKGIKSIDFNKP